MRERKTQAVWDDNRSRWCIRVQVDGYRKAFYSSKPGMKGKIEAERKADHWLEFDENDAKPKKRIKIKDAYAAYIKEKKEFNETTRQVVSYGNGHILPAIGEKYFDQVTEQDLQDIINNANRKGLAKITQQNIRGYITAFYRYARKCGYTKMVPSDLRVHTDAPAKEKKALQPEYIRIIFSSDQTKIKEDICHDRSINMYRLGILTGLRTGELVGLQWSDINGNVLTINRSINWYGEATGGKNKNARRSFILIPAAMKVLEDQRKLLEKNSIDSPWVFVTEEGYKISQVMYERDWKNYCKFHKIPYVTPYEMTRHTFISLNKHMPLELLKLVAGHSPSMDTTGVYGHYVEGEMEKASEIISENLNKILKNGM